MSQTPLRAISELGCRHDSEVVAQMRRLLGALHDRAAIDALPVRRDIAYGLDPRHRIDVYGAVPGGHRPAMLFVHGGGFVAGDKASRDGGPFYANIAAWAVARGVVGVMMNYRLAPAHPYPAGAEDVAAAIGFLHEHSDSLGVDPRRIFLVGQSAGAVHAADYLARPDLHHGNAGVVAAALVSGLYDVETALVNPPKLAYWGGDPAGYGAMSSVDGLVASSVPLLITVCEYDPPDFQHQAALLETALQTRRRSWFWFSRLMGQNHISPVFALGLPQALQTDALGPELERFFEQIPVFAPPVSE